MNQDNYIEEAFKMRNVLAEFESRKYGKRKPTILGLREHIFTGRYAHIPKYLFNYTLFTPFVPKVCIANIIAVFLY
jgi:callose synthase